MRPMPDFELHPREIPVSLGISQHLDKLCQALEMIRSGKALPETSSLGADLAALSDLIDAASTTIEATHWSALFYPSYSGNGGTLNLKEQTGNQTLVVSRDRRGALYNGMWMRLGENDAAVLLFDVIQSPQGYQLKINGEDREWNVPLGGNLDGLEWAAAEDVLSFVPEWLAGGVKVETHTVDQQLQPPGTPADTAGEATILSEQLTVIRPMAPGIALILEDSGQRVPLLGPLTIGRDKENGLCLEDKEVSRKHAVIEPCAGGWQLRDIHSSNGTWLNGKRISDPALLTEGDVIAISKTRMRVGR